MTWLMLSMRKMQLKSEVSDLQFEEVQISNKIQELANYTNSIADGTLTMNELASAPSSLFGTTLDYLQNSSAAAYQSATIKTNALIQQLAQTNNMTGNQYGYTMGSIDGANYDASTIFNEIYKEELKEYSKQMQQVLNEYEKELQTEQTRVETQLQAKEAELQQYENRIRSNIQADAIKF